MKRILFFLVLLCLFVPAQAEPYVYSNEDALNIYYECEDFDGVLPAMLDGAFDSRLREGDEILCGTVRVTRYHSEPDAMRETDALLALSREGRVLLLGARKTEDGWRCAVETDSFFAPGQRFDVTVLPEYGQSGQFHGASLALVCGEEEFRVTVLEGGGVNLNEYRAPQADGSTLQIRAEAGSLHARRYKDGILQESGSARGVLSDRLCGWTADTFPGSCTQVNGLEGAGLPAFAQDEAIIFGVNFREEPTSKSHSMGQYTARVRVLGRTSGEVTSWYQVQVGDTTGWVSGTYVCWPENERDAFSIAAHLSDMPRLAQTPQEAARHIVLRASPEGKALMQLPAGTLMQVICENDGWLHVILPKTDGWAMDWDGTYGYVRKDDVLTGISLADIRYR